MGLNVTVSPGPGGLNPWRLLQARYLAWAVRHQLLHGILWSVWRLLIPRFYVGWPLIGVGLAVIRYGWQPVVFWSRIALTVIMFLGVTCVMWPQSRTRTWSILKYWSRRRKIRKRWTLACRSARITGLDDARTAPYLDRIRRAGTDGLTTVVNVGAVGRQVEELERGVGGIRAVMNCPRVIVRELAAQPTAAAVDLHWGDPLTQVFRLADLPPAEPGMLTIGFADSGVPVRVPAGVGVLVVGQPGAGKSGVFWAMKAGLLMARIPHRDRVIDPKGGMELGAFEGHAHDYAETPQQIKQLLIRSAQGLEARKRALKERGVRLLEPTDKEPYDLLWLDEALAVGPLMATSDDRAVITAKLMTIVSQGRAPGWVPYVAAQAAQSDAMDRFRTLIPYRIVMRTDTVESTVAAIGTDGRLVPAHQIRYDEPGVGYIQRENEPGWTRFRAVRVTDGEARLLAQNRLPDSLVAAYDWDSPTGQAVKPRDCAVYIFRNREGYPLYIGETFDPGQRFAQHRRDAAGDPGHWLHLVSGAPEIHWCPDKATAVEEQDKLIRKLGPLANTVQSPWARSRSPYASTGPRTRNGRDNSQPSGDSPDNVVPLQRDSGTPVGADVDDGED